MTKINDTAF